MAVLGAAIGAPFGGPVADKYGRKLTIIIADIAFTSGAVIMYFSSNISLLMLGRFVVGVCIFIILYFLILISLLIHLLLNYLL